MSGEKVRIAHRDNCRRLKGEIDRQVLALRDLEPGSREYKEARRALGEVQIELCRAYDTYCGGTGRLVPKTPEELKNYGIE